MLQWFFQRLVSKANQEVKGLFKSFAKQKKKFSCLSK